MEHGYAQLTIFFQDPFWVGLYQREDEGACRVCRIVFGSEPKDAQVYELLLKSWHTLRFSPPAAGTGQKDRPVNPKRRQRQIKKTLESAGIGTKAQQALKLQQAQGKAARKRSSREEREADQARRLALHREKRREKHKGH